MRGRQGGVLRRAGGYPPFLAVPFHAGHHDQVGRVRGRGPPYPQTADDRPGRVAVVTADAGHCDCTIAFSSSHTYRRRSRILVISSELAAVSVSATRSSAAI